MSVQVEQKSYEMPPRDGFTVTHFLTVADIDRSAHFYEKVFGGRILGLGDSKGASGHIQIANTWLIVNVGRLVTSMIGNSQGETEIRHDLAEGVLPTGKALA